MKFPKLKSKVLLSTYDLSTLYTTLPYHIIKDNLIDLTERTFSRKHALCLACNKERILSLLMCTKIITYGGSEKNVKPFFG